MKIGEYEVTIQSKDSAKVGCQVVSRGQVEELLGLMNSYQPKFEVGDFVEVVDGDLKGMFGTVKWMCDGRMVVEFPNRHPFFHTCSGKTKDHHGFYFYFDPNRNKDENIRSLKKVD